MTTDIVTPPIAVERDPSWLAERVKWLEDELRYTRTDLERSRASQRAQCRRIAELEDGTGITVMRADVRRMREAHDARLLRVARLEQQLARLREVGA